MKVRIPNSGGPNNMNQMLKQAQKMQRQMEENKKALEEKEFVESQGNITSFLAKDLFDDFDTLLEKLDSLEGKVYVSIDMDVIDPAFAPSVGNPTPNGLHPVDVENIFEALASNEAIDVIGFDLVEVASDKLGDITAVLAAKMIYDFLTLFA